MSDQGLNKRIKDKGLRLRAYKRGHLEEKHFLRRPAD